ncbi:MAG: hypothetical protein HWD58_09140 [Bacteroidota bacterium]|nr:MAG: hypothetical protein HWD58_09140 [Bacteroidota bacterium]
MYQQKQYEKAAQQFVESNRLTTDPQKSSRSS